MVVFKMPLMPLNASGTRKAALTRLLSISVVLMMAIQFAKRRLKNTLTDRTAPTPIRMDYAVVAQPAGGGKRYVLQYVHQPAGLAIWINSNILLLALHYCPAPTAQSRENACVAVGRLGLRRRVILFQVE